MKLSIINWILIVLLSLASCNFGNNDKQLASEAIALSEPPPIDKQPSNKIETVTDRKIIKEGEITFETSDVNETKSLITKSVQELNGYIAKDEVLDFSHKLEHRVSIRIPAEKFDLLLSKITANFEKLDSKNISALDVTEEFIDVEARLKTKRELETRYTELLKKATKVEEILTIEKELAKQREEIESVEGRLRFLKDRISLSSLTVTYYQKIHTTFGFSSKFGHAFKNGWSFLIEFFIGLTHLWAFILLGIVGVFVYKRLRRSGK